MKLIAVAFVWLGCSLPHFYSYQRALAAGRKVQDVSLGRSISWVAFGLCQSLAIIFSASRSDLLEASLTVLLLIMCIWILQIILTAYLSGRPMLIGIISLIVFWMISLTGLAYV